MGIYSLENYEKYKTKTIRLKPQSKAPSNFGTGQIHYVKLPWASLEPHRGEFNLELINREMENVKNPILELITDIPLWVDNHKSDSFTSFIRRVGSFIGGDRKLVGVVISTINNSQTEWDGYIESFDKTTIFADLDNKELISYLKDNNKDFGLLVKCNEKNWIECCEGFAKQNLQHVWKKNPVLVHITDDVCGPNISREIYRWHGGLLQLYSEKISYELTLKGSTESWSVGDITHNEVLQLPDIESGVYTISIGLFLLDNTPIQLNNENTPLNGFYQIGTVCIDDKKRNELFNIWDTYYPEGYYPLEDPQVPEEE